MATNVIDLNGWKRTRSGTTTPRPAGNSLHIFVRVAGVRSPQPLDHMRDIPGVVMESDAILHAFNLMRHYQSDIAYGKADDDGEFIALGLVTRLSLIHI